jgi:hypothetical protein
MEETIISNIIIKEALMVHLKIINRGSRDIKMVSKDSRAFWVISRSFSTLI